MRGNTQVRISGEPKYKRLGLPSLEEQIEFGAFQKLGDVTTKKQLV